MRQEPHTHDCHLDGGSTVRAIVGPFGRYRAYYEAQVTRDGRIVYPPGVRGPGAWYGVSPKIREELRAVARALWAAREEEQERA